MPKPCGVISTRSACSGLRPADARWLSRSRPQGDRRTVADVWRRDPPIELMGTGPRDVRVLRTPDGPDLSVREHHPQPLCRESLASMLPAVTTSENTVAV